MKNLFIFLIWNFVNSTYAAPGVKVLDISTNRNFTCAILGQVTNTVEAKCWGSNSSGQLGLPTAIVSAGATLINFSSLGNVTPTKITAGLDHACALLSDKTVACWGRNQFGQLGRGITNTTIYQVPARVTMDQGPLSMVEDVYAGENHTCAIHGVNKLIRCWGLNSSLQLGFSTANSSPSNVPVPVQYNNSSTSVNGAKKVFAGRAHSCAIVGNNSNVYCWGSNASGPNNSLGNLGNPLLLSNIAKAVLALDANLFPLENISTIALVNSSTCLVNSSGVIRCVGANNFGQLGSSAGVFPMAPPNYVFANSQNFVNVVAPFPLINQSISSVEFIGGSNNNQFFCANRPNVGLFETVCWGHFQALIGQQNAIQIGIPNVAVSFPVTYSYADFTPRYISFLNSTFSTPPLAASKIVVGSQHACQIFRSAQGDMVMCWGSNQYRQLGYLVNPVGYNMNKPFEVPNL
jgi:alpha-tubulin suppressor-like RCC1 family protein